MLLLTACIVAQDRTETYQDIDTVVAELSSGSIEVRGQDGDEVTAETAAGGLRLGPAHVTVDGRTLWLDYRCGITCGGDLTLKVPWATSVDLVTARGDIQVSEVDGAVFATVGAGSIEATELRSENTWLATGAGDASLSVLHRPTTVVVDVGAGNASIEVPMGPYDLDLHGDAGVLTTDGIVQDPGADSRIHASAGVGAVEIRGRP